MQRRIPNLSRVFQAGACGRPNVVASPLLPNVVANWKLDNVNDSSASALTMTNNNSVTFGAGRIGNCANNFAAASSRYLSNASAGVINVTDKTIAVSALVYLTATPVSTIGSFVAFQRAATYTWNLNVRQSGTVPCFSLYDGSSNPEAVGATTLSLDTWYWILGTYNGTTARVYVNGVSDGTIATAIDIATDGTRVTIGANAGSSPNLYFNGSIDEVQIGQAIPSAGEIAALKTFYGF